MDRRLPVSIMDTSQDSAVPQEMLAAIQRDLHLTADAARTQLATQQRASTTDRALHKTLGGHYGGGWVDGAGALTVAVTNRTAEAAVRASGATPKLVARSSCGSLARRGLDPVPGPRRASVAERPLARQGPNTGGPCAQRAGSSVAGDLRLC